MTGYVPKAPLHSRKKYVLLVLLHLLVGLQAGAQYAAYAVGYHASLGEPVLDVSDALPWSGVIVMLFGIAAALLFLRPLRRFSALAFFAAAAAYVLSLGPVYSPFEVVGWIRFFVQDEVLIAIGHNAMVAVLGGFIISLITSRIAFEGGFPLRKSGSHGTAHWSEGRRLFHERGVLLGRRGKKRLRYDGEGHLLTIAPTGSGKGVGPIISNLLTYSGSVVVTDPKGENYTVTADYRRRELMQEVVCFDPFGVVQGRGQFNPLDIIDTARYDAVDHANALAESIVVSRGKDSATAAYFEAEAKALLSGFILFVCHTREGDERSLPEVRRLITAAPEAFEEVLEEMLASPACHGLIHRAAARLQQKADRERSGVISTVQNHTHFLDSPAIVRVMQHSTMQMEELKRKKVSVYLVLPPEHLDAYAAWLRLMISSCLMAMVRERTPVKDRVLFFLDEFANLGKIEAVTRAVTLLRGYGATIWMFIQNLAQLKGLYPEIWEMYLDVDVLQAFGTNDQLTADYLSRLTGEQTIHASTQSDSTSTGSGKGSKGRQRSFTMAEKQRRLLLPDEVRCLDENKQLLFIKGQRPVLADRLRYFEDEELKRRARPNPLVAPTAA